MTITSLGYAGTIMPGNSLATWATLQGRTYVAKDYASWRVSAVSGGSSRLVQAAAGTIAGQGVVDTLSSGTNAPALATLSTAGSRYDLIVARRTWQTTNATTLAVVSGTATRALPTWNTEPGTLDDQPLALVKLTLTGSTYSITEVVDLRLISWEPGTYLVPPGGDWTLIQQIFSARPGIRVYDQSTGTTWERVYSAAGALTWVAHQIYTGSVPIAAVQPFAFKTSGLSAGASGWASTESPNYSWPVPGGLGSFRLNARRSSGGTLTFSASGNPSVALVAAVQSAWFPALTVYGIGKYIGANGADYGATFRMTTAGAITLVSGAPNTSIPVTSTTGFVSIEIYFPPYALKTP